MSELESNPSEESVPFYPDHVGKEAKVVVGFTVIVVLIGLVGLFFPVGLGDPADPLNTPAHVKPEWYFLALYQLLKYISKTAGVVLPVLAVIVLTIWPFIDRKPDQSFLNYKRRAILVGVSLILLIAMTIWGEVS
jgi:quinol-cytochrome oxidoreductase complex cytochrome b subunit